MDALTAITMHFFLKVTAPSVDAVGSVGESYF